MDNRLPESVLDKSARDRGCGQSATLALEHIRGTLCNVSYCIHSGRRYRQGGPAVRPT
jgi:hypothetical protein